MRTLSQAERDEINIAINHIDKLIIVQKAIGTVGIAKLYRAIRPILDYAKAPQNFGNTFIENQALQIARAING